MSRRLVALAVALAVLAAGSAGPAAGQDGRDDRPPRELWEEFPLTREEDQPPRPSQARSTDEAPAPERAAGTSVDAGEGTGAGPWIAAGAAALALVLLALALAARRRRRTRRPPRAAPDRFTRVVWSDGGGAVAEAAPAAHAGRGVFEVVWRRDGDRAVFALAPVDGEAAGGPGDEGVSPSFPWAGADDPSPLPPAQRAHARLREELVRAGWEVEGRGRAWFAHRFSPPSPR